MESNYKAELDGRRARRARAVWLRHFLETVGLTDNMNQLFAMFLVICLSYFFFGWLITHFSK